MINRRHSIQVRIGNEMIGGENPILIQGMTKCDTRDVEAVVKEIKRLSEAGCKVVRLAVPDIEAAHALANIRKCCSMPMVADIHFRADLALESLKSGVDKLRINPGNLKDQSKLVQIVHEAKSRGVSIRIGVNAGSLESDLLDQFGRPAPEAMVESALRHAGILERLSFKDIVISMKSSSVMDTIAAYRMARDLMPYPFHVGVTETGPTSRGIIKSAIGIGALLSEGIGDTIRVSLTGDSAEEIKVGYRILSALGLENREIQIISCPTCGRCQVHLREIVDRVEKLVDGLNVPLTIAVMGCIVNGPGEAREADVGVACGKGRGAIFRNGKVVRTVPENKIAEELLHEVSDYLK